MIRFLLWLVGGLVLGGIIHIVVILALPSLAEETLWSHIERLEADNRMVILPPVVGSEPNPLALDPQIVYGVCVVNLAQGPAYVRGMLPDAFWSVAIYDTAGIVSYSTTNRDGIGQTIDLGIFNSAQTRLLAQQEIDIEEGVLVVESTTDSLAVVVRLSPPHAVMRDRFAARLAEVSCGPRP